MTDMDMDCNDDESGFFSSPREWGKAKAFRCGHLLKFRADAEEGFCIHNCEKVAVYVQRHAGVYHLVHVFHGDK